MEGKWWSILGLCGLVSLLIRDDKPASSMSGIRRRARRLFFIYDGKTIAREQVNEAKRLARAGYGTLYATWAYTANEARGLIREGKAERLSGLGEDVSTFKKGDRVMLTKRYGDVQIGKEGTITRVWTNPKTGLKYGKVFYGKNLTGQKLQQSYPLSVLYNLSTSMFFKDQPKPDPRQMTLFGGLGKLSKAEKNRIAKAHSIIYNELKTRIDKNYDCLSNLKYPWAQQMTLLRFISGNLTPDENNNTFELSKIQKQFLKDLTICEMSKRQMALFGGLGYKGWDEEGAINATIKAIDKFQGKTAYVYATYTGVKSTQIKPPLGQPYYRVNPDGSVDFIQHLKGQTTEERIRNPKYKAQEPKNKQMPLFGTANPITLHGLSLPKESDSLPPILAWVGGKTKLADKIISMMPPHKTYVEPFLGGGSVFFKKPLANVNVINDLDSGLMSFYKGVRDGSCEKIRACDMPKNRTEFNKGIEGMGKDVCSYLGVNKRNYGCQYIGRSNSFFKRRGNVGILKFQDSCERHKDKLSQAKILNKDFKDVIKEFDSKDTLAYIDPPYADTNQYKHSDINPEDVAKLVKSMKGKAIVSYNNHSGVRKAFAGLNFHKVNTRYEIQKATTGMGKDVSELLITNF